MNRSRIVSAHLYLLACLVTASVAGAESTLRSEVETAFAQSDYERVELFALRRIAEIGTLPRDDQVEVNLIVAYSLIMLDREHDAREWFRRAIDAKPTLRLDPLQVSPRFRTVFDDVKTTYAPANRPAPTDSLLVSHGPRRSSVLINLALPGLGQWREGKRLRGTALIALQTVAAGVWVWRMAELRDSRDRYVSQSDRNRIRQDYEAYDADFRAAWVSGLVAGAVYVGIQTDLALLRREAPEPALSISPITSPHIVGMTVSLRY